MMAEVSVMGLEVKEENYQRDGISWPYSKIICVFGSGSASFEAMPTF
jgi:hypothetical protein